MLVVYVRGPDRTPLMPCTPAVARLLLKAGKAKVLRRTPFTIKLLAQPEASYTPPLTLGVDTGSAVIGAAVADQNGHVLYLAEVQVRNDIAQTMKERAAARRNRRHRKTRYRPASFRNRRNSIKTGRLSPTMRSKIVAHLRAIRFVKHLLPISSLVLESGTFDPHALKNPEVLRNTWLYQRGSNYGYANTKAYVLTRDTYTWKHCKGKSKERRLAVHHPVFRSEQGSDEASNLLTLCRTCHDGLHAGTLTLKQPGKQKGTLLHATQMNSIRLQLLRLLQAEETWGFVTKEHRQLWGLPKAHVFDAAVIATRGQNEHRVCALDGPGWEQGGAQADSEIRENEARERPQSMDDGTKNHAKFLMRADIVFVCNYRKNVFLRYGGAVNQSFTQLAPKADFSFEATEIDRDHIHF